MRLANIKTPRWAITPALFFLWMFIAAKPAHAQIEMILDNLRGYSSDGRLGQPNPLHGDQELRAEPAAQKLPIKFAPAIAFSSGGNRADSVAIGDVNGDGKLDLVVANDNDDSVGVLLGNGDGTFQAPVVYGTGGNGFATSVALGDVNGDGHLDMIVANFER